VILSIYLSDGAEKRSSRLPGKAGQLAKVNRVVRHDVKGVSQDVDVAVLLVLSTSMPILERDRLKLGGVRLAQRSEREQGCLEVLRGVLAFHCPSRGSYGVIVGLSAPSINRVRSSARSSASRR
jgi:hypothetical protein